MSRIFCSTYMTWLSCLRQLAEECNLSPAQIEDGLEEAQSIISDTCRLRRESKSLDTQRIWIMLTRIIFKPSSRHNFSNVVMKEWNITFQLLELRSMTSKYYYQVLQLFRNDRHNIV